MTWTGGVLSGTGKLLIDASGRLELTGNSARYLDRTLDNSGTILYSGFGLRFGISGGSAGIINNLQNATFSVSGEGDLSAFSNNSGHAVNNAGTFIKSGAGTTTSINIAFTNTGTVNVQSGSLEIAGGGSDTGSYGVNPGTTLRLGGNRTYAAGATVEGAGAISFISGTHDFGGQYRASGALSVSGARVNLTAAQAVPLAVSSISVTSGVIDLQKNPLTVLAMAATRQSVLEGVSELIRSARNRNPLWSGAGITTSAATALTGLAVRLVGEEVRIKYTWNGDVDQNGKVDAADYFAVDSGFLAQSRGYANGDLNYDGRVDAADYFLIDSAFLGQSGILSGPARPALATADHLVRRPRPHRLAVNQPM